MTPHGGRRWRHGRAALGFVPLFLVVFAGCLDGFTHAGPTPEAAAGGGTPGATRHPGLESVLDRLTRAENGTAFAREHGLRVRDGRVLVVIELAPGRELPGGRGLTAVGASDGLVEAYVAIGELRALAAHRNVTFVRTPREPVTESA